MNKTISRTALFMCCLAGLFYCYEYYLRVAPSVISSELKLFYHISDAKFGNLVACYMYAYVIMQIPVGIMMDKYGPRKILTFACLMCAVGTCLFASSTILIVGQLGRFLVGFGSAFAFVGVLKIANTWLPPKHFALVVGLISTLGIIGGICGSLLMTVSVDFIGWQHSLYIAGFAGLILTIIIFSFIRDNKERQVADINTQDTGGFLSIVKNSNHWRNGFIGFLTYLPMTALADMWAIPYFKSVGLSNKAAAMCSAILYIGFGIGAPFWGWISDKLRSRRLPMIMGSFLASIMAALILFVPNLHVIVVFILLVLLGAFASCEVLVFAVSNDLAKREHSATSLAFANMLIMLGGAIVVPLIGKLLDHFGTENGAVMLGLHDHATFTQALALIPVGLALAGILAMTMRDTYHAKK